MVIEMLLCFMELYRKVYPSINV